MAENYDGTAYENNKKIFKPHRKELEKIPPRHQHKKNKKAFPNQNCSAMDFLDLRPKFQAAIHYHQHMDCPLE